jgi:hypothetical protein
MLAVLAACTSHEPASSEPGPPQKETVKPEGCGELSYGIHYNPGDDFEAIAARRLGAIQCATPCDPKPEFALSPEGRNEHGGYGFIEIDPAQCEFPGMPLGVASCVGVCDGADVLGQFQVALGDETPESRLRLCRAFEQRWGPPDVGSCDCTDDEIVWRPRSDEPGAVLNFMGTYLLDCGFPPGNYLPKYPPG